MMQCFIVISLAAVFKVLHWASFPPVISLHMLGRTSILRIIIQALIFLGLFDALKKDFNCISHALQFWSGVLEALQSAGAVRAWCLVSQRRTWPQRPASTGEVAFTGMGLLIYK